MNIENFEKRAQSEFERFRPEVDTEQIWQNIEPHLKKKKRRLLILFFWGLGFGLLLLSVWKWNAPKSILEAQNADAAKISVRTTKPDPEPASSAAAALPKSGEKQLAASMASSKSLQVKDDAIQKTLLIQPAMLAEKAISAKIPSSLEAELSTAREDAPIPKLESTVPAPELNPVAKVLLDQPADGKKETLRSDQKKAAKAQKPARIKPNKRKSSDQTIAIRTGMALPLGILKRNDQVEPNPTLLKNRKASEKNLEAFTADIRYAYASKKGLMFMIGLDYKRINEKFKLSYTEKETKTITGVLTQTVDAAGAVIAQTTGPKEVTTTRIYSNIAYNQYQFLNLLLGLGYQGLNKRSRWEIAGGLDLGLWFHFEGTHYNAYGNPDPWSAGVYKRNAGMGLWTSYGYSRNLSRNIRWQVSAKAGLPIGNITSTDYPLIQKYFTLGLQGGLIFNLIDAPKSKHKNKR